MELLMAFGIGLLGGVHCIVMCGPIAFALPLSRTSVLSFYLGSFSYNFGRILTYSTLGLILGVLGYGFNFSGFQQGLSIIIGLGMILYILSPKISRQFHPRIPYWNLAIAKLKASLSKLLRIKSLPGLMAIGMLNGLLPCGLVYFGLAGSMAMASPIEGAQFMLFFGLGTLPLMLATTLLGKSLQIPFNRVIKTISPVLVVLIGCLFILRGMELGIPFLSPADGLNYNEITKCN